MGVKENLLYHKIYKHPSAKDWVVFVHGAGGSSSIWFRQIRDFKQEFNVLLIDLRGHGKSRDLFKAYVKDPYTFQLVSKDVLKVMDHLNIPKAHFIGVSLGTVIIRTLGELAPERMHSTIMGGAVVRLSIRSRFFVWLGNMLKNWVPFMWLYRLFAWIILPRKTHKESRNLFIREAKKLYRKEFLRWFNLTQEINPLLKYFKEKELQVPTLYVMGEQDYMFLPPLKSVIERHRFAQLEIIPNCGHVCNVERPTEFNQRSIAFIKQLSTSPYPKSLHSSLPNKRMD